MSIPRRPQESVMIKSAVTISLVEEARGGPFVYWHDLPDACRKASQLGFDAVEIFAPGPQALDAALLRRLLDDHGLCLAAVGTGAGWVRHKLHLCLPDAAQRGKARDFIKSIIDMGAPFGAPAIIGSMQGRHGDGLDRAAAMNRLADALGELGQHAKAAGTRLLFEPLNRYETNMVNTIEAGVTLLRQAGGDNVALLADLFHMNIEEVDIAAALGAGGRNIGHVHFVDSNRRPAGMGHIDYTPIAAALRDIPFVGYASAEAAPYPDSDAAAKQTMDMFRRVFF
jgi:sugar phosphate isomerase/epimerase